MSAHETLARQRKAIALADEASRLNMRSETVATSEDMRVWLVERTGVRAPSLETWKLVVSSLVARERSAR